MFKKIISLSLCVFLTWNIPVSAYAQASRMSQPAMKDDTGLRWIPWLSAGTQIWNAVIRIDPKFKEVIGTGETVAVAITDIDYDGRNDIILNFWGNDGCGVDGCLYLVLKANNSRSKFGYIAKHFELQGRGVNIDGRYLVP